MLLSDVCLWLVWSNTVSCIVLSNLFQFFPVQLMLLLASSQMQLNSLLPFSLTEMAALLQAAGYLGVWTAASAWYIAFAELLNETWFRGRVRCHFLVKQGLKSLVLCSCWLSALSNHLQSQSQ